MHLLSTAYWPNLQYFYFVLNKESVLIEQHEHYQKQSYRNRTQILTANGALNLSIPVIAGNKTIISQVEISFKEAWQIKHWRAITSAYKNSPYFEFFEQEIKAFYIEKPQYLLEYNTGQLNTVLKILRLAKKISGTLEYEKEPLNSTDLRNSIHPKNDFNKMEETRRMLSKSYYQTFENKFKFTPNLSILDLLFNQGLETLNYLKTGKEEF